MATSGPLYEYVSDVKRLDGYRPGGYHPIQLSDKLQERYSIVEKLGYGSYSTIWLARDENLSRYVAIKIGIAEHSSKEAQILEQLSACPTYGLSENLIAPVLDCFEIQGPNGTHLCLVTIPARCSLVQALQDYDLFPLDAARSLAAQLVMAVARIHKLGIVHGGQSQVDKYLKRVSNILQISISATCSSNRQVKKSTSLPFKNFMTDMATQRRRLW
jgi:serine/threonine-protein kinase SRPK3